MSPRTTKWNHLTQVLMCLFITFLPSCEQMNIYEGVYITQEAESSKSTGSQLELMEKRQAVWRVPDDEVSFRWEIKDNEIWLSTKSGGIIIGKIQGDIITITLPGSKQMSFKKQ